MFARVSVLGIVSCYNGTLYPPSFCPYRQTKTMATFFGEVVSGPYRYFDDEDEDAVDNARDASFSFRSVYGTVSRDF
jgi:hypothetical protein